MTHILDFAIHFLGTLHFPVKNKLQKDKSTDIQS